MKQQTAVEWLIDELRVEMGYGKDLGRSDQRVFDEVIEQAKAMERTMAINFHDWMSEIEVKHMDIYYHVENYDDFFELFLNRNNK